MGSPTTKTNYHEKNKSGNCRSRPAFPPPHPFLKAYARGSGTAASGAWRGRVRAPQGPARAGSLGRIQWGPPQAAAERRRPEREISHSGQATRSHAPSCPHSAPTGSIRSPSRSLHLAVSAPFFPSLSFVRPLPWAQPRIPIPVCSPDIQIAAGPVPRSRSRRTV